MAERFNGNSQYPRRGTHGSNQRGVFPHESRSSFENQRAQALLDNQKRIDKFNRKRIESELPPAPRLIDLGNKSLAAYEKKFEFQQSVIDNPVTIFTGQTGSGKSTQGIQFLIELILTNQANSNRKGHVYGIVPRQLIADNLGDRIRSELSEHFGDAADGMIDIIHGDRSDRTEGSLGTIITAQALLKMMPDVEKKSISEGIDNYFFGDEIHEKDLQTGMAVAASAIYVNKNKGSRLILASATMDEPFVQATYKDLNDGNTVPIVNIPGRPYSIQTYERPDLTPMEAYLEYGDDVSKMMTFTRGEKQLDHYIEELTKQLDGREKGSSRDVVMRKLISKLTRVARLRVFIDEIPETSRLSIISTPAGMSGITNAGNKGVITDGVVNRKKLDLYGVEGLEPDDATQAELTQMYGRAGRDIEGGFAVLTKPITVMDDILRARGLDIVKPEVEFKTFAERAKFPPAQIYSTNLSSVALDAAGLGHGLAVMNTYFQDKVELVDIVKAERNLIQLGALDEDHKINDIGKAMLKFPLSPELSRGMVEARQKGRTVLHMARAAFILSAINGGGLQDFSNKDNREWEKLIRPTTTDDFIAQLDIMTAIYDRTDFDAVAEEYDLEPKKVEQVSNTAGKVFKQLGIRPEDIVFTPPKPEEEDLLRDDFTPGMINLVYGKSVKARKSQQYLHILGNEGSTQRSVSDRSSASEKDHEYIAGFPRWYVTRDRSGEKIVNQIVDRTLVVRPEVVARYAAKIPSMLKAVQLKPSVDGGRVIEQQQMTFGPFDIGGPVASTHELIPETSRELLKNRVLQKPGDAQKALRDIAEELDWFEKTIPQDELSSLKNPDAPELITSNSIEELIFKMTASTRDMHVVDELLASEIFSDNISIFEYYDQETIDALRSRSPKTVIIGKSLVEVYYDNGQPYITKVGATQKQAPHSDFFLPDGREILIQRPKQGGGTERISVQN